MLVGAEVEIQAWRPNFSSSGQRSPAWSRLLVDGRELCNALEDVDWSPNPVQVELCDACGTPGCASGGYADLSRLGEQVLWTPAVTDGEDDWARDQYAPAWVLVDGGAALFPPASWQRLRERFGALPAAATLVPTTRRMLAEAWRAQARRRLAGQTLAETMEHARRLVLTSDRWDRDEAVAMLTRVAGWLGADPHAPVEGELLPAARTGAVIETFYTDGPTDEDWPALGVHNGRLTPAFRPDLVLWPPPLPHWQASHVL
jgi:hypothetical protein